MDVAIISGCMYGWIGMNFQVGGAKYRAPYSKNGNKCESASISRATLALVLFTTLATCLIAHCPPCLFVCLVATVTLHFLATVTLHFLYTFDCHVCVCLLYTFLQETEQGATFGKQICNNV